MGQFWEIPKLSFSLNLPIDPPVIDWGGGVPQLPELMVEEKRSNCQSVWLLIVMLQL